MSKLNKELFNAEGRDKAIRRVKEGEENNNSKTEMFKTK